MGVSQQNQQLLSAQLGAVLPSVCLSTDLVARCCTRLEQSGCFDLSALNSLSLDELKRVTKQNVESQFKFSKQIKDIFLDAGKISKKEERLEYLASSLTKIALNESQTAVNPELQPQQLTQIFHLFRTNGLVREQLKLYELCDSPVFKDAIAVKEFAALAYKRIGNYSEALNICRSLTDAGNGTGFAWNILADTLTERLRLLEVSYYTATRDDIHSPEQQKEALRFVERMLGIPEADMSLNWLKSLIAAARKEAFDAYYKGFNLSPSCHAGLGLYRRTLELLVELNGTKDRVTEVEAEQLQNTTQELARFKEHLPSLLKHILTLEGGPDSSDYWYHAAAAELSIINGDSLEEIRTHILRAAACAPGEWALGMTRRRFESIQNIEGHGNLDLTESINYTSDLINEITRGTTLTQPSLPKEYEKNPLLRSTYSGRGLIGGALPIKIEGGFVSAGTRVPDIIFSRTDAQIIRGLIEKWGLLAITEPREFLKQYRLVLHSIFKTAELQNATSVTHDIKIDKSSAVLSSLFGLPGNSADRSNIDTTTNAVAAALSGVGDCREHAALTLGGYAIWERNLADNMIRDALDAIIGNDTIRLSNLFNNEIPELLQHDLRAGAVGIYIPARAQDTYKLSRDGDGYILAREYKLGEKLEPYEIKKGSVCLHSSDGCIIRVEPNKANGGIPNTNGVPNIPEGVTPTEAFVLTYAESHTATFLFCNTPNRGKNVEFADSFYANFPKSYQFASGEITESPFPGLLLGGAVDLKCNDGDVISAPVLFSPNPRSSRSRAVSFAFTEINEGLRLFGSQINVSVTGIVEALSNKQPSPEISTFLARNMPS